MFNVSLSEIEMILRDFDIHLKVSSFIELQRYNYEKDSRISKQVRLIEKIVLEDNSAVVIRLKNETGVSHDLIEKQSQFADLLRENGVLCPVQYKSSGSYARQYTIDGYDVIVTVEGFEDGELKFVDRDIAERTGRLLAQTHNIAEGHDFHVKCNVLFNPFEKNELFSVNEFMSISEYLDGENLDLYLKIIEKYNRCMEILSPLKSESRYAVQGDISICNLYQKENGDLGLFDFNRCGDNNLYCDAVMQAMFEARLMDYPKSYVGRSESVILPAFLKGYCSVRPFSEAEREMFPYFYAIIDAFWSVCIIWDDNSLIKELERKDSDAVRGHLERIWKSISVPFQESALWENKKYDSPLDKSQ